MLPTWEPDRIIAKIPFNLGLAGGRRQGKSTAVADLLQRMSGKFDLVLCMVGSAACNPVLESLLSTYWDPRFFFSTWDQDMIDRLLQQQEELLASRGPHHTGRRDPLLKGRRPAGAHDDERAPLSNLDHDVRRELYKPPQKGTPKPRYVAGLQLSHEG